MSYSSTAMVKSILFIETADTQFDTWLDELRDYAYAEINQMLRDYVAPPLTSGNDDYALIKLAEAEIVAGMFRKQRSEKKTGETEDWGKGLEDSGKNRVLKYIEVHYLTKSARSDYISHGRADHSWDQG